MALEKSRASRPPRWVRIVLGAVAVIWALGLITADEPSDVVFRVFFCGSLGLQAVAPRGLYDGRFNAWLRAHPVVNAGLTILLLGTALYVGLSIFLADWLGVVIALPLAAGAAAWAAYRARSVEQTT
ncbi:hypothetical protein [Kribbella sp. VKM Ac-2568]|uniref:hypothetical protein n=1 Tax=Kribbella sp. VKM Ac-2568 TaxID=2512219 RepID=UPI0010461EE2|nr:hypothetical protein [Kribbella sp. VKM Ac-2568]TCM48949.1 hypothetical protein EV648_103217 [Kribbella sp. VKM Ac-2568]